MVECKIKKLPQKKNQRQFAIFLLMHSLQGLCFLRAKIWHQGREVVQWRM